MNDCLAVYSVALLSVTGDVRSDLPHYVNAVQKYANVQRAKTPRKIRGANVGRDLNIMRKWCSVCFDKCRDKGRFRQHVYAINRKIKKKSHMQVKITYLLYDVSYEKIDFCC